MKVKNLFFSMLALVALASCSNDDDANKAGSESNLLLKLTYADPMSKAIGDPVANNTEPDFETVTYKLLVGNTVRKTGTITKTEAVAAGGYTIADVPDNVNKVQIVTGKAAGEVSGSSYTDYNTADADVAVANIQLSGEGVVEDDNPSDGIKEATVNLVANVARFEVFGKIEPATTVGEKPNLYRKVEVVGVYCNNFYNTMGNVNVTNLNFTPMGGDWTTGYPAGMSDQGLTDIEDENGISKCAAYQVFPVPNATVSGVDHMPHIILKMKVTTRNHEGTETTAEDRYFTIKKYNTDSYGGNADLTTVEGSKIYKLNIAGLAAKFNEPNDKPDPEDPTDPNPEQENSDLQLTVTVVKWTQQNIFPNI